MRLPLHLAVAGLAVVAAPLRAQVQDEPPTPIQSPALPLHRKPRAQDLSWMWQYTEPAPDGRENLLTANPRFLPFLQANLTAPQSFWNHGEPLPEVAQEFLAASGTVSGTGNRYLTATGCVPHFCSSRGLLWVDTGLTEPLVVFAALNWISENRSPGEPGAAFTLWIFPNRALSPAHLPPALVQSIAGWTAQPAPGSKQLQDITRVFLVDPSGTPHTVAPTMVGAHNTLPAETTGEPKAQP